MQDPLYNFLGRPFLMVIVITTWKRQNLTQVRLYNSDQNNLLHRNIYEFKVIRPMNFQFHNFIRICHTPYLLRDVKRLCERLDVSFCSINTLGQIKIDQKFEQFFWDFDNKVIQCFQYFHCSVKVSPIRKIIGYFFAIIGYIINYIFALELWMLIVITLTMYEQDGPARKLNYFILLNILYVQTPKRFFFRKRPGQSQPPRAIALINQKNSSFPSASIVQATTITFALLGMKHWVGDFAKFNQQVSWTPAVGSIAMYVVSSFTHINMGAGFPSDCILSIIPIILVIISHHIGRLICEVSYICPSCDGGFCYYNIPTDTNIVQNIILRSNFDYWNLNGLSNTLMLIAGFVVLSLLVFPLEYWQKATYFLSMIMAIWVFQNTLLCPNEKNNFSGVYSPSLSLGQNLDDQYNRTMLVVSFIIFTAGVNWIVSNILTKRTGAVLSGILVTIFYCIILLWSLHCLITVRLLIQDNVQAHQ